jgi:tetratricopeptide (TPR) repeat protein
MHALEVDNEIAFQFAYFVNQVKAFSAMDRTDINRVAQNVLVPIFDVIYGYSKLRNLDVGTGGNFPGIDLADDIARVTIQVTSTPGIEKVKHTLEQFLKDRPEFNPPLAKKYDRLIVYILTEKQRTYSQTSIDLVLEGRFSFDASTDIWDYSNLLADIKGLPLAKKESVLRVLKSQLEPTLSQIALTGLIKVPEGMRTGYFVGRDILLEQVHAALTGDGSSRQIIVLTGMGGIGKTQAALGYVLRHRDSFTRVLWSGAASEDGLIDSLKSLAHALLPNTGRVEDPSDILAALTRWMDDAENTDWLLVVDGADFRRGWTPGRFKALLPATKQGKLLITSQYQDFSAFPEATVLPVDPLPAETAGEFMRKFAQRDTTPEAERAAAEELAGILGGLPLALEQAAAYVRTTGISFSEYKTLLHKYGLPVLPADFDHATDYQHSVQTVCRLAFETVQERLPTAKTLLEFITFLSAESNCLSALSMLADRPDDLLVTHFGGVQDATLLTSNLLSLVGTLQKYSLLTVDHDKATVRVHRIVQMAARDAMSPENRHARLISWSEVLGFFLRGQNNSANWGFIEGWVDHARSVAESVLSEGIEDAAAAKFLERLSTYLEKHAHYREGLRFATRAASIRESALLTAGQKGSLAYAESLVNLGIAHLRCNENNEAVEAQKKAIDILKTNHPEESSLLAAAVNNLASVYVEGGEIEKAEPLFEQLLGDTTLRSSADRRVVAGALSGMAFISSKRQDYGTAAALAGEAVVVLESETDPDMFNLATAYNTLGVILAKGGRLDKAQAKYERTLELYRTILPESHPLIANLENNLGYLFFRRKLYGQALPMIYNSIPRLAKALGPENPHTQQAARNYLDCVEELKKRTIAVVFQKDIESGEFKKHVDANTIGMVVISPIPERAS